MLLKESNFSSISGLRNEYFKEIKLQQELFLEWMILKSSYFKIIENNEDVGYFIISPERILLEFYLIPSKLSLKEDIFKSILSQHSVSEIYCKSFDHVLQVCGHTFSKSSTIIGTIFRDLMNVAPIKLEGDITIRIAEESDISNLTAYHDSELYEKPEELDYMVVNKMLYLFEKEDDLIGCGFLIKILPDKNYYDIGMWTNPKFRQQGYATKIISYLKNLCLKKGDIPSCGCAVDNKASRKTLERNGFISKYCIISFSV